MMRSYSCPLGKLVLLLLGSLLQNSFTNAFLPPSPDSVSVLPRSRIIPPSHDALLRMSDGDDDNDSRSRLRDLGYSDDEIERSMRKPVKGKRVVRVDMVDNVDATTLTAVGFGLIAFNFFVLANAGDGGIGGFVATIINSF